MLKCNQIVVLKNLYRTSKSTKLLVAWFKNRKNTSKVTKLRVAQNNTGADYGDLVGVFKLFEYFGYGKFVKGAKGHETRFIWRVDFKSLASEV